VSWKRPCLRPPLPGSDAGLPTEKAAEGGGGFHPDRLRHRFQGKPGPQPSLHPFEPQTVNVTLECLARLLPEDAVKEMGVVASERSERAEPQIAIELMAHPFLHGLHRLSCLLTRSDGPGGGEDVEHRRHRQRAEPLPVERRAGSVIPTVVPALEQLRYPGPHPGGEQAAQPPVRQPLSGAEGDRLRSVKMEPEGMIRGAARRGNPVACFMAIKKNHRSRGQPVRLACHAENQFPAQEGEHLAHRRAVEMGFLCDPPGMFGVPCRAQAAKAAGSHPPGAKPVAERRLVFRSEQRGKGGRARWRKVKIGHGKINKGPYLQT